jgi:cation diffusion facilitator family transporter
MEQEASSQRVRIQVALLAIGAGCLILGLKYYAYHVSGSAALMSDAYESVVNVLSGVFALGAVLFAGRPADTRHPYGRGKIEHFSAAFEGGMISLAAMLIIYEALRALLTTPPLSDLNRGLLINFGAGALNGMLGAFLVRVGRTHRSQALMADGHHVLSDFYTTLGIGAGLLLVKLTGLLWLDALMALGVGLVLARTGFRLVKESSEALLDKEDPELVARLVRVINEVRPPEVMAIHEMRTLRSGRYVHVDIHIVIPEFLTIAQGHDLVEAFNGGVIGALGLEGEFHTHTDPCQRAHCRACAVQACPVRVEPQTACGFITAPAAVAAGPI